MKTTRNLFIATFFILILLITACGNQESSIFYNASFEVLYPETEIPMQWYSGSEFGLFFGADSSQYTEGKRSLLVKSTQPMQRWGAMSFLRMMDYDLEDSIRTISIAMDIKADSVSEGYFSPFIWKQEKAGEVFVKNLAADSLKGSVEWQRYVVADSIEENIDQDKIFAGIQLNGKGKVWVDHVELFINGKPVGDTGFDTPLPTAQDLAFIKKHSTPFERIDPYAPLDDLAFLSEKIKDAEIVGLGEATHGTSEIFTMKHRLFRYLVEKHDFKVFFLEGLAGASYRINEYIHTGIGDPIKLVKDLGYWTWTTEEVLELIKWMRQYNVGVSPQKRVSFVGVDIQDAVGEIKVIDSLSQSLTTLHDELMTIYSPIQSAVEKLNSRNRFEGYRDSLKVFGPRAKTAIETIETSKDRIITATNELHYHWLLYMAKSVDYYLEFNNVMLNRRIEDPFFLSRDSLMAANIQYVQKHLRPGKAAYWAHNAHIADAYFDRLGNMVGKYLKREYGDDYRTIAFSFERGYYQAIDGRKRKLTGNNFAYSPYPGCFEYLLSQQKTTPLFFDVQESLIDRPDFYQKHNFRLRDAGAYAIDNQFATHPIHEHYDYLIYFGETTAAKGIKDERVDE